MTPYRILHNLHSLNRGGAETFIMNVLRHIDRDRFQFDFLLHRPGGDYEDEVRRLGCNIYYVPSRSDGFFSFRKNLDRFFDSHPGEWDAVHAHVSSLTSIEVLQSARRAGIGRRIIHSHSTNQPGLIHSLLHRLNKFAVARAATDFLACSDVAARWLYKGTPVASRAVVLKNGVDTRLFAFDGVARQEVRREFGIPDDAVVLGHVGSLIAVKNHSFLLDVFAAYRRRHPASRLLIVGRGNLRDELEQKARQLAIDSDVIFAGTRPDINRCVLAMDIMVFPSLYEGLPVALVEAQAAGLPVLASDRVSAEAAITPRLRFRSLDIVPDVWASDIEAMLADSPRSADQSEIIAAGYDIMSTVSYLCKNIYRPHE